MWRRRETPSAGGKGTSLQAEKDKCKGPEADWTLRCSWRPETQQFRSPAFREVSAGLGPKQEAVPWKKADLPLQHHSCVTNIPRPVAWRGLQTSDTVARSEQLPGLGSSSKTPSLVGDFLSVTSHTGWAMDPGLPGWGSGQA